jgi:hypothetical protein
MSVPERLLKGSRGHPRVALCRREAGMAKNFLNHAQVRAAGAARSLKKVRRRCVAQEVGPAASTDRPHRMPDDSVDRASIKLTACSRQEHPGPTSRCDWRTGNHRSALKKPRPQRVNGGFGDRHGPWSATFADDPNRLAFEVESGKRQITDFRAPEAAAVEKLKDGVVSEGEGAPHCARLLAFRCVASVVDELGSVGL